tara:strand:+ start:722 stop:859 length:138 start_codon:yes stop_codon:yes gene_type:complete
MIVMDYTLIHHHLHHQLVKIHLLLHLQQLKLHMIMIQVDLTEMEQ